MNLLIVNGYDKKGWNKLQKNGLQHICDFYRDQLLGINSKINTTYIHPSIELNKTYSEDFFNSFHGIVWTGSSLNIYDNTKEIKNQITLMKKLSKLELNIFGSCWGMQLYTVANKGDVKKNSKGREVGIAFNITLNEQGIKHDMYKNKPIVFDAFASHVDHITTKPEKSTLLAENHYSIQALVTKKFWGTQYHPEFNFHYTGKILKARKKILINEKCFTRNQLDKIIHAYKKPSQDSFSKSLIDDKIRKRELSNWLKYIK